MITTSGHIGFTLLEQPQALQRFRCVVLMFVLTIREVWNGLYICRQATTGLFSFFCPRVGGRGQCWQLITHSCVAAAAAISSVLYGQYMLWSIYLVGHGFSCLLLYLGHLLEELYTGQEKAEGETETWLWKTWLDSWRVTVVYKGEQKVTRCPRLMWKLALHTHHGSNRSTYDLYFFLVAVAIKWNINMWGQRKVKNLL